MFNDKPYENAVLGYTERRLASKAGTVNIEDQGRTFPDVINEWTNELLRLNQEATIEQVALILHLGTLGQRLIFEANAIGQNEALRMMLQCEKERN